MASDFLGGPSICSCCIFPLALHQLVDTNRVGRDQGRRGSTKDKGEWKVCLTLLSRQDEKAEIMDPVQCTTSEKKPGELTERSKETDGELNCMQGTPWNSPASPRPTVSLLNGAAMTFCFQSIFESRAIARRPSGSRGRSFCGLPVSIVQLSSDQSLLGNPLPGIGVPRLCGPCNPLN